MAINWLTALRILPWSDMIEYAPKLVSGAQKAWQRVKTGKDAAEPNELQTLMPSDPLFALQQEIRALQAQQVEQSTLLKQLADQNQRLVDAVAVLRLRSRIFGAGLILTSGGLIALAFATL